MEASRLSSISIEGIQKKLQEEGFKLTLQRQATVEILLEHLNELLTAEEIYMFVKQKYPDIGLATVYRTLEILTDLGIISRNLFDDVIGRYHLKQTVNRHFAHHLLCVKCGQIQEVEEDLLVDVEQKVLEQFQFQVLDHRLTFHGICKNCQQKEG